MRKRTRLRPGVARGKVENLRRVGRWLEGGSSREEEEEEDRKGGEGGTYYADIIFVRSVST